MKKKEFWFFLFAVSFIADLFAVQMNMEWMKFIFKPMILVSLMGYFIVSTINVSGIVKTLILFALAFSLLGDVLLMFEASNALFFILGLSAFLIAHLGYIFSFHQIRIAESVDGRMFLLIPVIIFYFVLMYVLEPHLGALKLPVRIYGVVISFMLMLALHLLYIKNKKAGWYIAIGALFFICSDSLLAINKFYISFPFAGVSIMATYGLAQFFIIKGAVSYINSGSTK